MSSYEHDEVMAKLNRLESKMAALAVIGGCTGGSVFAFLTYQWAMSSLGLVLGGIVYGATFFGFLWWASHLFDRAGEKR